MQQNINKVYFENVSVDLAISYMASDVSSHTVSAGIETEILSVAADGKEASNSGKREKNGTETK